jgi:hypothetical protein
MLVHESSRARDRIFFPPASIWRKTGNRRGDGDQPHPATRRWSGDNAFI